MNTEHFWEALDQVVASSRLVIDRPRGTTHPRFPDFVYPYDYGYLEGTQSMDGGGIDVWVGSLPERRLMGVVCTVDLEKRDSEIKLLLGCTPQETREILRVHNDFLQAGLLIVRGEDLDSPAATALRG